MVTETSDSRGQQSLRFLIAGTGRQRSCSPFALPIQGDTIFTELMNGSAIDFNGSRRMTS